jgi:hypothetical protein
LLVESTAANAERAVYQTGIVATTGTLSVYVKSSGRSHVGLRFYTAANNWVRATYTLSGTGTAGAAATGSSSTYSDAASGIQQLHDGWYRVRLTATKTGGLSFAVIDFATTATPSLSAAGGNELYTGDGTSGLLLWGAQLEAGAFPTSYIPTTGTAATRTADVVSITGANFSSWFNPIEGTLSSTFQITADPAVFPNHGVIGINDSSTSNRLEIRHSAAATATYGGVNVPLTSAATVSAGVFRRQAIAHSASSSANSINGLVSQTGSASPIAATRLALGMRDGQTAPVGAITFSRLTYWPTRLPNSTLQNITL